MGIALGLLSVLLGGQVSAMPVQEAVRLGLAIRPEVRAAQLDAEAAGTDAKVAAGGFYPTVSISTGPLSTGLTGASYEVTASQMLYDWGHVGNQVEGARALEQQLSQDLLVKRDTAAFDIVATYLDVLSAQQHREVDARHIARLQEILDLTQNRSQSGYADSSEPARTLLELTRARQQMAADDGKLADGGNQFRLVVGASPVQMEEPAPPSLALYVAKKDLGSLILDAPLYRKAVEDSHYAEAQLEDTQATLLPQLNFEASAVREDIGGVAEKQAFVGLRLRLNTFQGISNFQKVDAARQRVDSSRSKRETVVRDIRRQVQSLFDMTDMLKRQEDAVREQVDRSAGLSLTYQEQFRVGRRDVIELINLQLQRFQAERDLVDLHLQAIRAQYQAAAQLGLIGPLLEGELGS